MRQMEQSKREYIDKLKRELEVVEDKWAAINNENCMAGEDYRSEAFRLVSIVEELNQTVKNREIAILERQTVIESLKDDNVSLKVNFENQCMETEELLVAMGRLEDTRKDWEGKFDAS